MTRPKGPFWYPVQILSPYGGNMHIPLYVSKHQHLLFVLRQDELGDHADSNGLTLE